jgi:hypothetical protein
MAPLNAIKVKVFQDKKQIIPLPSEGNPYVRRVDELARLAADGEQIHLARGPQVVHQPFFQHSTRLDE